MHRAAPPRLVGLGVGPGDPELLTVKALRLLGEADAVLVPATEASGDGPGRAEQVVLAACPDARISRIPFSRADRRGVTARRQESWQASAERAVELFAQGAATVVFATIGDPSVYSTFSYLAATVRQQVPDVAVELVPGITAMQALAAASGTPLVEGTEVLALVPVTSGLETLERALDLADTVVAYKGGRQLAAVAEALRSRGREAVVGTDVGLSSQRLMSLAEAGEKAPYFSTVLSAPRRETTGGAL